MHSQQYKYINLYRSSVDPESPSCLTQLTSTNIDNQTYIYDDSAGTGTFAYVLDTGIRSSNPEFQERVIKGVNLFPEVPHDDDIGHGTHVAGTIGSSVYGVAKNCTLVDVKTSKVAYGTAAVIIQALDWVAANITNTPGRAGRSVISISLGKFL